MSVIAEYFSGFKQAQEGILHDILRFGAAVGMLNRNAQQSIIMPEHQVFKADRFHAGITPCFGFGARCLEARCVHHASLI